MRVCHFSSVHDVDDIRVFVKECSTLAENGFEVYLVACGFEGEKKVNGVHIIGLGNPPLNRMKRMTSFANRVFHTAMNLNCDIYHFHDPELLPYGVKIKRRGKRVVFDSHEDVPAQIMDKYWIPKPIRKAVSSFYKAVESFFVRRIDGVVTATPYIAAKFRNRVKHVIDINNFPRLDDIVFSETPFKDRDRIICYAGGINELRGEKIMLSAMENVDGMLFIAGEHEVETRNNVHYIGKIDRKGISELYGKSIAGLCVLKPIENYINSQPIKMYEYMAAGIPFICSDFPKWREVADRSEAGICIPPDNPGELSRAISELLNNPDKAQRMGANGHKYVIENCTWQHEGEKLTTFYQQIVQ